MTWEQAVEEISAGWQRLCNSLKGEIEIRDARIDELNKRVGELIEENYKLKMQLIDTKDDIGKLEEIAKNLEDELANAYELLNGAGL